MLNYILFISLASSPSLSVDKNLCLMSYKQIGKLEQSLVVESSDVSLFGKISNASRVGKDKVAVHIDVARIVSYPDSCNITGHFSIDTNEIKGFRMGDKVNIKSTFLGLQKSCNRVAHYEHCEVKVYITNVSIK